MIVVVTFPRVPRKGEYIRCIVMRITNSTLCGFLDKMSILMRDETIYRSYRYRFRVSVYGIFGTFQI